jgi:cell division protein FtsZ
MFEIQDAAKVITESIDPDAKIIFGTVRDDKLKKNEVKISVIATGFPEGVSSPGERQVRQVATPAEASVAYIMTGAPEKSGKIFNTLGESKREATQVKLDPKKDAKVDDDDDWGAVPAFLRRSRLK